MTATSQLSPNCAAGLPRSRRWWKSYQPDAPSMSFSQMPSLRKLPDHDRGVPSEVCNRRRGPGSDCRGESPEGGTRGVRREAWALRCRYSAA